MFTLVDLWRLIVGLVCLLCVVVLINRYRKQSDGWNSKTRDYWYSSIAWCAAGVEYAIEGFIRQSNFSFRIVFISVAALVTLKGLLQKGSWGGD